VRPSAHVHAMKILRLARGGRGVSVSVCAEVWLSLDDLESVPEEVAISEFSSVQPTQFLLQHD
jgi:hypothetical protein